MKKIYIYILIFIFILSIFIFAMSSFFNVTNTEITGTKLLQKDKLLQQFNTNNKNIFLINKSSLKKIVKNNYYIKDLSIKKYLPNKISINIQESDVAGYIPYLNEFLLIDKSGIIVDFVEDSTLQLPIIKGLKFDTFTLGKKPFISNKDSFDTLLKFISHMGEKTIPYHFEIDLSDLSDIHIYVGNIDVIFGKNDNINIKINTLIEILKKLDINEKGFLFINDINSDPIFKFLT